MWRGVRKREVVGSCEYAAVSSHSQGVKRVVGVAKSAASTRAIDSRRVASPPP